MAETDKLFAGAIPDLYDRLLVPLIFADYARDLAARVARLKPHDILEIAAGTGVVTRALAPQMDANARLVATDLNQPMLDLAAERQGDDPRITWRQADALALPFQAWSFDVVLCQFGAMFFPDRVQAYREAHRVLKPGGYFLVNVWDAIEANELPLAVTEALARHFPDDPPRFLARTPYGYGDPAAVRADLEAAGFRNITLETLEMKSGALSAEEIATGLCQGSPLRNEIEARDPTGLHAATRAAADALRQRFGEGAIVGRIRAHVVSASR
ncbi:methyltransferase domain-containing protein [Sinorhizobium sp. 8-89]|uniref:class I SAM-dependent methyltransferase n=1 Tax=Sinorhizobium sp. 7-81 TaxID=3049087 RepID=UPI0024C4395C|nr:methyltransferase domain-containing protein [Sinorhizobium sp. 7-81]MDK1388700.1 methyltransferase domain-containing protein [Sinorhizobium sp. 7-81]